MGREMVAEVGQRVSGPLVRRAHCVRDGHGHELWFRQHRQIHGPHAVWPTGRLLEPELQGQSALAHAARPGDRDEAVPLDHVGHHREVGGSADEQVQGPDEVVAIGGEGTDRWELGSPRDIHLEEPDRVVEVPEAVAAGIVERDDHVCGDPGDRVRGHQHLAAVARRADARRLVHRHGHVAVCAWIGQAAVHAHAHSDPSLGRPGLLLERCLAFGAGEHGLAGVAEGDEERVPLGADLEATMRDPAGPQERPVPLEEGRIRVTEAVQQAGRALDVGEHERHVPRRQATPCMLHFLHHPRQAYRCRRRSLLMPRARPRARPHDRSRARHPRCGRVGSPA